jgi:UDP-3-O-[3-hydroxymyristoyl] glucosamine N-acyltransferase
MYLKELENQFINIKVIKDGYFDRLDYANSNKNYGNTLTFVSDSKFIESVISNPCISAIIISKDMISFLKDFKYGLVVSDDPKETFLLIHNLMAVDLVDSIKEDSNIDSSSQISKSAIISKKNVKIGKNCYIEDNVVIYENVQIKDNVTIRSGSIIGCQGFRFFKKNLEVIPIITTGNVIIHDNVEIQHNSCVDRGVIGGTTIIHKNCKIDKFVHVAHDCEIGEATFIAAGVRFGGVTKVGKNCWIGLNATISNGLQIGDNCRISLGSVVTKNLPNESIVSGNFAIDHDKFINFIKTIR